MDTNTAINNIKKIARRVESGEFNRNQVCITLQEIRRMLNSLELTDEASSMKEICHALAGSKYSVRSVNSRLSHIMASLKKIKGKGLMGYNEDKSRKSIFGRPGKHKDVVPVKRLSLYDVVLVQNKGEYQYGIVAGIQHNENVVCYPLKSGTHKNLGTVGCNAVQLSGSFNGRFKDAFITSSYTTIPYQAALNCYVGKFDNVSDVRNAIKTFKENVI